jgi:UDP-N-acetylmuramoylalanine--D-glutamate ligase
MKKYGILGIARSGIAAAKKIKLFGHNVILSDNKPKSSFDLDLDENFEYEFDGHTNKLLECDTIIVSPGIPLTIPIIQKAKERNIELISEIEFGFRIKHPDSKIIAITGSNGKSTTVSLIYHILKTAGYNVVLGGNIGEAFTSFPIETPGLDYIVLELSSFQLELIDTFHADVAAILNITPDHLNRYAGFDEYARTKFNIFNNQTEDDLMILNKDDSTILKINTQKNPATFSMKDLADIYFDDENVICNNKTKFQPSDFSIKGPHNIANIMAALLAVSKCQISQDILKKALRTFSPLPHRMEFAGSINGIEFYNDSKATNTDSVRYALQSFGKPITVIMGGAGKGEDYSVLNEVLRKYAKHIYLVGDSAEEMYKVFKNITKTEIFPNYESCISDAVKNSQGGDIVVLSPACTSYDNFINFEHRGDYFKQKVKELKNEIENLHN